MTPWMLATLGLLPPVAAVALRAGAGRTAHRLVAAQLLTALVGLLLALMSFAFDQSSFIDLALATVLLSLPGTLLMTLFLERWL